jgi:hypothetical protein
MPPRLLVDQATLLVFLLLVAVIVVMLLVLFCFVCLFVVSVVAPVYRSLGAVVNFVGTSFVV